MNLLLALYYEHQQRTGHAAFNLHHRIASPCNVCLHLGAEKRREDEKEAEHYRALEKEAPMARSNLIDEMTDADVAFVEGYDGDR